MDRNLSNELLYIESLEKNLESFLSILYAHRLQYHCPAASLDAIELCVAVCPVNPQL